MTLTVRVDLNACPWDDDPGAADEAAQLLMLLDAARIAGWKLHFFVSRRALACFPTYSDAILGEGHHLDGLIAADDFPSEWTALRLAMLRQNHRVQGVGVLGPAPAELPEGLLWVLPALPAPPSVLHLTSPLAADAAARIAIELARHPGAKMRTWRERMQSSSDSP